MKHSDMKKGMKYSLDFYYNNKLVKNYIYIYIYIYIYKFFEQALVIRLKI